MGLIMFCVGVLMAFLGTWFAYTALFGSESSIERLNRPFNEAKLARELRNRETFGILYREQNVNSSRPRLYLFLRGAAMLVGGVFLCIPEVGRWLGYEHNPWF